MKIQNTILNILLNAQIKWKDIFENIDEYNPGTKHKALVVFDDMITDKISKKNPNPMSTELFIRGRI